MTEMELHTYFKGLVKRPGERWSKYPVILDTDHATSERRGKVLVQDPCYADWTSMVVRVYSSKFHERKPTYAGATMCKEWHRFSNFEKWWEVNHREGCSLDKDILGDGLTYSPEFCVFVPESLNNFLCLSDKTRGDYPVGVSLPKGRSRFRATCTFEGKRKHLGCFCTPEEAHAAWVKFKVGIVVDMKDYLDTIDVRLCENLIEKVHKS